jgi:hypothetical protein
MLIYPTTASPFEDTSVSTASHSPQPTLFHSRTLSQSTIIILLSTIPTLVALALITGTFHFLRRRNKRRLKIQHEADIAKSLRRARRPTLFVDTDLPRSVELERLTMPFEERPPVPRVPENVYLRGERAYTRRSVWMPGVWGRRARRESGGMF